MNKAIFLDRDGTINVDYGYVYKKENLKFIDGVIEGLKILSDLDYKLIIVTKQSGIGRGMYTEKDFKVFNKYMLKALKEEDINIDINNSFAIGDKTRDLAICKIENVNGILLTKDNNKDYICKNNLLEAAEYIKELYGSDV